MFYKITSKSHQELNVETNQALWEKVKGEHNGLAITVKAEYTKSDDNKFHVTFSTDSEDRHWERVYQNFDLKHFKENPVLLDSHNYSSIEHIIGRVDKPKVKDGKLQGDVIFALENPKGLLAYHLANGGFLNATSIGFIPLDFDEKGDISKSELLEISAVSVPANPEALFEKIVKEMGQDEGKTEAEISEETPEIEKVEVEAPETENGSAEPDSDSPTPPEGVEVEQNSGNFDTVTVGEGIYKAVIALRKDQQKQMMMIAEGLKKSNPHEQKRKVYKAIREALKSR